MKRRYRVHLRHIETRVVEFEAVDWSDASTRAVAHWHGGRTLHSFVAADDVLTLGPGVRSVDGNYLHRGTPGLVVIDLLPGRCFNEKSRRAVFAAIEKVTGAEHVDWWNGKDGNSTMSVVAARDVTKKDSKAIEALLATHEFGMTDEEDT